MKNKVLSVCFLIVVLIGVCAINAGASTEETKTQKPKWVLPENFSVEDAARQDESNTQYEAILNYFTQDGVINYPEYYAGAYINNSNYLVVKVTDSITDKNIQELRDVTNNSNLIFEQGAEYSYRYLLGLQEKIINYCNSGSNDAVINNISETMVYNATNNLEVVLNSNNTSDISLLMSEIFSETSTRNIQQYPILFTQADADNSFPEEEPVTYANGENTLAISDFYPGLEIQVDIQDGQVAVLTSGFQCYRKVDNTYQYGFITSAHGSRSYGGQVYDKNGNSVGSVRSASRVLSGKVDAAFVQVPSIITMHNTISTVDGDIFLVAQRMSLKVLLFI